MVTGERMRNLLTTCAEIFGFVCVVTGLCVGLGYVAGGLLSLGILAMAAGLGFGEP